MIKYRPHHFLCTIGFQGLGYSSEFIANFQEIVEKLKGPQGDHELIQVVNHTDDICSPCPKKRNLQCASQMTIEKLDRAHRELLRIQPDDILSWKDAKDRIKKFVTVKKFKSICEPCDWQKLGICEKALKKLKLASSDLLEKSESF